MDKKTLPIIILLLVAILFYWQILEFFGIVQAPAQPEPGTTVDTVYTAAPPTETLPADSQRISEPPPATEPAVEPAAVMLSDTLPVDTIVVRTGKYAVTLVSLGGGPVSMILNEYTYRDGRPIEMLPDAVAATPEAKFADDRFSTSPLRYQADRVPGTYDVTSSYLELNYTYRSPDGGEIIRTFVFYPDTYHFDFRLRVNGIGTFGFERFYTLDWNTPLGVTEPDPGTDYDAMQAVAMQAGSRVTLDDFDNGTLNQVEEGDATWAGVRSKYFTAVMIPQEKQAEAVRAQGRKTEISTPAGTVERRDITAGLRMHLEHGRDVDDRFRVVVGPLDYLLLAEYDVALQDMLDIGTTPVVGILIKPFAYFIIWLLPILYAGIPNYGLVIILFAFLIKVVTLPLSLKSFKSMNAMKELQPRIEKLKEKHKKNPQALNQEMMKLYKKHGVNPLSGCLPILPQMPLLIALFRVFSSTILLRDAPFVWFIDDLSKGATGLTDPYMILVVLMVVMQFISQKLTMGASQQNKALLYIMPLFMGFIFYSYSAGLVLYWTCFSAFSMLDYLVFRRGKNKQVKTA
ncbi:MAG: membrane protein insertase YidC [Candidatus Zixiibacteriota bacterium]|nr:MAG: membrane protein insertase YidC [candidate division Zixibacteria bacterium]